MNAKDYLKSKLENEEFAKSYSEISDSVDKDLLNQIWHEGYHSKAKSVLENPYSLNSNPAFHYKWRDGFESKGKPIKYVRDEK